MFERKLLTLSIFHFQGLLQMFAYSIRSVMQV
jgi:hypothetical protein